MDTTICCLFFHSFVFDQFSFDQHHLIDAAHYTLIVTRIVNSACVKRLIDFKTSSKVSVTIAGDCNSIGTLDVMIATWNVLCVFIFCIELLFIVFDNVEIAFRIFVFEHSRHSIESTNWTQQFVVYFFIHSSSINSHSINTISLTQRTTL